MGCACLRGGRHHRVARGAGRAAAGGRQQGGVAHQPDAARLRTRTQLLRRPRNAHTLELGEPGQQRDALPDRDPIGQSVRDRDRRGFRDPLPLAIGHDVSVAER